jgi:archaellum component FlaG (FlaF/FlaG flagellin family)
MAGPSAYALQISNLGLVLLVSDFNDIGIIIKGKVFPVLN